MTPRPWPPESLLDTALGLTQRLPQAQSWRRLRAQAPEHPAGALARPAPPRSHCIHPTADPSPTPPLNKSLSPRVRRGPSPAHIVDRQGTAGQGFAEGTGAVLTFL